MQFSVKRDILLKSLNFVQGVVEKKNTLPILSNVLLQLKDKKLSIIATDLDIVFYDEISDLQIIQEGNTTTSANVLFDILNLLLFCVVLIGSLMISSCGFCSSKGIFTFA